jgi:hypothetical protein
MLTDEFTSCLIPPQGMVNVFLERMEVGPLRKQDPGIVHWDSILFFKSSEAIDWNQLEMPDTHSLTKVLQALIACRFYSVFPW